MRAFDRRHDAMFAEIPRHRVFEGDQLTMNRADGSGDSDPFFEAQSDITIPFDEMVTLELPAVLERFEKTAQDLLSQRAKHFFATISAGADKVGNTIDAKGQKLTASLYLDMIDKIWLDFEPDGSPKLPTMVIHPDLRQRAQDISTELQTNPDYRDRFAKIIERKREEWRAREANRELAG
jgi:hypothetical protein